MSERLLPRNLATEYAQTYGLDKPAINETGAQYRERIACELERRGQKLLASEVLFNQRMSGDPFAYGSLDRGFGLEFITKVAQQTEAVYQHEYEKATRVSLRKRLDQKFGRLLTAFRQK